MKIIRLLMKNNGTADNFINTDAVGEEGGPGDVPAAEQRREITRVKRMGTFHRIVVAVGVGKRLLCRAGAGRAAVQMEPEETAGAGSGCVREPLHGNLNQYGLRTFAELDNSVQRRMLRTALDNGIGGRSSAAEPGK